MPQGDKLMEMSNARFVLNLFLQRSGGGFGTDASVQDSRESQKGVTV